VIQEGFPAIAAGRQQSLMFVNCFDDLVALEEIQNFLVCIKLVDRRVFLFVFDILTPEAIDRVHPGGLAVEVGDDRPPPGLSTRRASCNRPARVAGGVQHTVRPDRIEGVVFEGQVEGIGRAHIFGLYIFYFEVLDRHRYRIGGQVGSRDADAALQEFQAVIAHAAADLQQMFALQQFRFPVDTVHDPRKFIGVHPRPDVSKEFRVPGLMLLSVTYWKPRVCVFQ
jgi:hypothetical protein